MARARECIPTEKKLFCTKNDIYFVSLEISVKKIVFLLPVTYIHVRLVLNEIMILRLHKQYSLLSSMNNKTNFKFQMKLTSLFHSRTIHRKHIHGFNMESFFASIFDWVYKYLQLESLSLLAPAQRENI